MTALAAFVWAVPVALGAGGAAWINREGGRLGWNRALASGQLAALALLALWGLVRGFDWLASGGGPLSWVGVTRHVATSHAPLDSGLLRLGLGAGLVFAVALLLIARLRSPAPRRMPLGLVAAGLAAVCALLLCGVYVSNPVAFAAAMPLDLAAVTPVFAIGTGLTFVRLRSRPEPGPAATAPDDGDATEATEAPSGRGLGTDPRKALERAKLLEGGPTFESRATGDAAASGPAPAAAERVWQAAGGLGAPASCIDDILARIDAPTGAGGMMGDLPGPTERAVADSIVIGALFARAARVLVIGHRPDATRDRLRALLGELGARPPGPLVAGDGELRDTLARNVVPALVCLDLEDLAGQALSAETGRGSSWLTAIGLVLLDGVDRMQPIGATHMAFALRRLAIALDERRVRPTWCAIGGGSSGSLRYVEDSTMVRFESVPLGAANTAGARVWLRSVRGDDATPIDGEIDSRAAMLRKVGLDVAREDGVGGDPEARPGYHGDVSLARLEDRHLAGLYLARNQLAHRVGCAGGHLGIWWVHDTPLSRFLLNEGALAGLEQRGELNAPRPVAGLANRYLAATHLEAALRDGRPDVAALRRAFGDRAVTELLEARREEPMTSSRARFNPTERTIERAPIVVASGSRTADPRQETITASFIEVKSSRSGEVLARVDRRVAPTRFYPHRVFRAGDALYQVGGEAVDPRASSIIVKPAAANASPTLPQIGLEIRDAAWLGKPKQVQMGKLNFARGTASVELVERVTGAIPRGKGTAAVKYAPVTSDYPTEATVILFAEKPSTKALAYAGAMVARLVSSQLLVEPEDVDVIAYPGGFGQVSRPALVFVDRHLGGMGVADALDAATIHNLFRWTWGILYRCPCMNGCETCTPPDVLAAEPDKVGALKLLGG